MKNAARLVKKCGGMRGQCGCKDFPLTQDNSMGLLTLTHLRGYAGVYLYTYAYARTHTHTHVRVTHDLPPLTPATGLNSLNDKGLKCGGRPDFAPAVPPQTAGVAPASGRGTS